MGNVVAEVPGYGDDVEEVGDVGSARAGAPGTAPGERAGDGPAGSPESDGTAQVVEFAVRTAAAPESVGRGTDVPAEGAAGVPRKAGRGRTRSGPNKREVRHQQTREAIVDAAAALFSERGFDAVSVQQIAQRAGVVEKTVFNHFPVKEGLVFEADPPMGAALVAAVRRRPAGESAAAAAGSFVVAAVSQLGSPAAADGVAEMARVIRGSRTLQVREREILGTLTDALAEEIALETHSPAAALEPWLAAHAVLGLYAAMLELARDRVLAGASGPELVAELRATGRRGLALLQFGLAGYAKRR
ncbi:TetR/AcrR family transcriptional regulator [Modestobacter lapidis]